MHTVSRSTAVLATNAMRHHVLFGCSQFPLCPKPVVLGRAVLSPAVLPVGVGQTCDLVVTHLRRGVWVFTANFGRRRCGICAVLGENVFRVRTSRPCRVVRCRLLLCHMKGLCPKQPCQRQLEAQSCLELQSAMSLTTGASFRQAGMRSASGLPAIHARERTRNSSLQSNGVTKTS